VFLEHRVRRSSPKVSVVPPELDQRIPASPRFPSH
jgi:hypothetical protein